MASDPSDPTGVQRLERRFERVAWRVRGRLALRSGLIGLSAGAALGALAAGVSWWQRLGDARLWLALAPAALGLAAGLVHAWRRRWSDSEVALFLDARLDSAETITTALELGRSSEITPAAIEVVQASALSALEKADSRRARPGIWHRLELFLPLGAAGAIAFCVLPLPLLPAAPPKAPGSGQVRMQDLAGLDKIEALDQLNATTPEERERLKRIAEAARRLRAELARGLEKREALAQVAKLRDDIAAERLKLGDGQNRAGLDAAVSALEQKRGLERAARALSEGDLVTFDEEMQRIANLAEQADRDAAKQALNDAAKAAKKKGAEALSKALEQERKKFEEAQAKAEALRELARELGKSLDKDGQEALEDYGEHGSLEAQRKLTDALERALKRLSEEERKRLAENLKKKAADAGGALKPMTRAEIEDLARKLSEKDADKLLEEQLRELARRDPSEDAARERGLGEADRGGAEAQRGLGALPLPMAGQPGAGGGKPGEHGPKSDPLRQNGQGGPGSKHDEGQGEHEGETKAPGGKELRSKADARLLPGAPMHGATLGRAPARAGETANQLGTGSLGAVGQTEIGAVDGTDIPEEYREQVGRYFEP